MLNISRELKGNLLEIRLFGPIEERSSLDRVMGTPTLSMRINCRGVTRINSVGVKSWIRYFSDAREQGTKLRFTECPPNIVEQMNIISNFVNATEVESICVPYACLTCRLEQVGVYRVADLKPPVREMPCLKCSQCGGRAEFDDLIDEYFAFLNRKAK